MSKLFGKLPIAYFGLVYLFYFLLLFISGIRTGVMAAGLMVLIAIEAAFIIKSDKLSDFISVLNVSVLGYLLYNLFSVVWIMKNGYPVSIFAEEFSNSILPIVFYFAAVITCGLVSGEKESNLDKVYKGFLFAFTVFSIICIIMYLWAPQFYCDFLYNMSFISKADASTCRVRMEGFSGSTSISYLGVAAMLVASKYMYKNLEMRKQEMKNKKSELSCRTYLWKFIVYAALFVFSLAVVFLANGRAGMVAAILVILYLNFLVFFSFDLLNKKILYIEMALIVGLIIVMCIVTPGIAGKIGARLISLPGAVGQRSEQWIAAINNMHGQWFGNGLGANGHKAIGIEWAHVVPDGGIVKLYCEEGAIGFSLFLYIMIITYRNGIKNIKKCFCELGIIGTALLMSIGSNIIAFQMCMPIVWFSVGAVALMCKVSSKNDSGEKKTSENALYMTSDTGENTPESTRA